MSVTSREVAAILSTAGPMAPPSDDDDNYSDDDVTEERHDGRLSSGLQLLRVSFNSSNTSTSTAIAPRHGNAVQLNNGWSGRGAEQFRPSLNGVFNGRDDMIVGQANGGDLKPSVRSWQGHPTLFDLLSTHRLLTLTLQVQPHNGHHIRAPPFQVSSRRVI